MKFYNSLFPGWRLCLLFLCSWGMPLLQAQQINLLDCQRIAVPSEANAWIREAGYDLDHGSNARTSYFYADAKLLRKLKQKGVAYEFIHTPARPIKMISRQAWQAQKGGNACAVPLDAYPTYGLYEQLMSDFAAAYPAISRLHILGTLPSGRRILALEITDFPEQEEAEPKVLLSASMHGDELGGYHLSLRLISHLLCNYGQDEALTQLVNNTEIWINPLANPDGAYWSGDDSVADARRFNRNGIDLNRNFPDPDNGPHPDGHPYQAETLIFMDFADNVSFDLAMNFHGGAEVFNYPWDTYSTPHADDAWWRYIGRQFANDCQHRADNNGFFTDLNNGITNGYAWYPVAGGRQDYANYFHRSREVTLEISRIKLHPTSQFEALWEHTHVPILNFIRQSTYGLRGAVTDSITGQPLLANISIPSYDKMQSDIYTKLPTGRYHRYLKAGTYTFLFQAAGYQPKTITYQLQDDAAHYLPVRLAPLLSNQPSYSGWEKNIAAYYEAGQLQLFNLPQQQAKKWQLDIFTSDGRRLWTGQQAAGQSHYALAVGQLPGGIYFCRLSDGQQHKTIKFQVSKKKR